MGGLLLALSNELMGFNYRECFVGPFDVSNKVRTFFRSNGGTADMSGACADLGW